MAAFVSLRECDLVGLLPRFQTRPERLMASNEAQTDKTQRVSTIQGVGSDVGDTLNALWNDLPLPSLVFLVIPTNPCLSTTKWLVAGQLRRDQQPSLWQHTYIL